MSKSYRDSLVTNSSTTKVYYVILRQVENLSTSELSDLLRILKFNHLVDYLQSIFPEQTREHLVNCLLAEYYPRLVTTPKKH